MVKNAEATLNESQEKAVLTTNGPLLVIAGAGSGKTKVLVHRIAHLIEKGARPDAILALTFTNKAASEMKERVLRLLSEKKLASLPWMGTFHSLCVYILRESGKEAGIKKSFSIADDEDSLSLIKSSLRDLGLDPKQFEPKRLKSLISKKKNEMQNVDAFKNMAGDYFPKILASVWELYEEKLKKSNLLDFDDLLLKTAELFKNNPEVLKKYQERWKYIHIDEYQDTNLVQYHLTHLLAKKYQNICVVGDVDQAIYSWRGADFRNILHFERDWPGAVIITLEENYRSTQLILDAANSVIVKNKYRVPKNLFSKQNKGAKITVFEAINEDEEAEFIAELAAELKRRGESLNNVAVLYRTNFQSRVIEEKMLSKNLDYQVIGVKFYERKEIKDILAYVKAAINSEDLLSKKRIINTPPRGIGKVLLAKYFSRKALSKSEDVKISELEETLSKIKKTSSEKKASEAIKIAIKLSGLETYLDDGTEDGAGRLANIKELASLATRYDQEKSPEGILKLMEDAALMSDQDTIKNGDAIKMMTVHAAKGLEFKIVFIAGLEEGLFPSSVRSAENGPREEELKNEEERRLFYVALTRAKQKIFLSWSVFRTIFGSRQINRPSTFLFDIPPELMEKPPEKVITLD